MLVIALIHMQSKQEQNTRKYHNNPTVDDTVA